MAVYGPFRGGLSASKNYSTHPILAVRHKVEDGFENKADQRQLSNAGLDRQGSEHITEGKNEITDLTHWHDDDADSICETVQQL